MKVDFAKVYRNGITGRAIAEAMMAISAFTRGTARGGYGMWARRALQGAGLIAPKAFLSTIADFSAICRKVDRDAIANMHSSADAKFASSEASDKGEKSSVARARDAMKRLDVEAFTVLASAVDTLASAGFMHVEIWIEGADGVEYSRVDLLANILNDVFYRGVTNAMRGNAIAKNGIGNGVAVKVPSKKPATVNVA